MFEALAEKHFTKSDILLAFGGGVTGDLTGLAAALYLRGVHIVQIPTTLLSQVDSSVGGKTAIDVSWGKNLVGTFYQPRLVIADTQTLTTLPDNEFASGLAEVIKYGCIWDEAFFEKIDTAKDRKGLMEIIDEIISAAHKAPTGCNFQPQRILVLNTDESVEKLKKCTKCHFDAPTAMLICYNVQEYKKNKTNNN